MGAENLSHEAILVNQAAGAVTWLNPDPVRVGGLNTSEAELAAPVWRCETFDWADYGVELTTAAGRVFTVSSEPPQDSIGLSAGHSPRRRAGHRARCPDTAKRYGRSWGPWAARRLGQGL